MRIHYLLASAIIAGVAHPSLARGQVSNHVLASPAHVSVSQSAVGARVPGASLDSLIERAIAVSPAVRAANARVDAASARIGPASAFPDPMLMFGIINQPLGRMPVAAGAMTASSGPDEMTMRMVGVTQTLPFAGKRALQRREAALGVDVARASMDVVRRQVVRDVKAAWYEIAFVDQALSIIERNRDVLGGLIRLAEIRYSVGSAGQQDVLRARVEATRLAETASGLLEQRRAAVARVNASLDQPTDLEMPVLAIPDRIARAAVAGSSDAIRFTSSALGARAADSPLRPLAELQAAAVRSSPELREQDAMIAEQNTRLAMARKAALPDVGLSLQYGQRGGGLPDMVSATLSIPLPIFKGGKQDQQVVEASAQLVAAGANRAARANGIRAEIARMVAEIERQRTRLALETKAVLPQSRAALASAASSYQVGKVEFITVLENQATVFGAETEYFRTLSDFATMIAELERVVGEEVLK